VKLLTDNFLGLPRRALGLGLADAEDRDEPGLERRGDLQGQRPVQEALRLLPAGVSLRWLGPGDAVSYGGHFRATRRTHVATVPMGYADGYPRRANLPGAPTAAAVLVRGQRCPVLGSVCMDMIMVDVTALGEAATLGDEVVLLGGQGGAAPVTAAELAERAGLLEYEITCGVSKRVPRVYRKIT